VVKLPVTLSAPHRLLFLVGAFQFASVVLWWSCALLDLNGAGPGLPQPLPSSMIHAPLILFLVFPPFFFGFLLTVFPRWIGFPDARQWVYVPVGLTFLLATVFLWLGLLMNQPSAIIAAFTSAAMGWIWALIYMGRLLIEEFLLMKGPTWHAWSIFVAIALGLICLIGAIQGMQSANWILLHISNLIALDLFILPVFVTVCHRMIPFFAGNVVADYERWRPFWVLAIYWAASIAGILAYGFGAANFAAISRIVLACLTALMLWKWWPRAHAPGLLWVLVLGFAWAPAGFALGAWFDLFAPQGNRAAIHLLTIGFAGSLVIAMVTRVTQGHSGRPLTMPHIAWIAFALVQIASVVRLIAALRHESVELLVISASCLTAGLLPWALRAIVIYSQPRADGKPG